jgi:hypothetical protein
MSETVNVNPSPIQRNSADVAIELTIEYFRRFGVNDQVEMTDVYSKFYATAEYLKLNHRRLEGLVPVEIVKLISR